MRATDGHTLPEALVSMTLLLLIGSAMATLLLRASGTARLHAQRMEHQQRARVALDAITRDIRMAGAGADLLAPGGPLVLAAVWPSRVLAPDTPDTARPHVVAALTVVAGTSQSSLSAPATPSATALSLTPAAHCPVSRPACGFSSGQLLAAYAESVGGWLARVTSVGGSLLLVAPLTPAAAPLPAGAVVAEVSLRAYEWDVAARMLRLYDSGGPSQPFIDDVTGFDVAFLGPSGDLALGVLQTDAARREVRGVRVTVTVGEGEARVVATTAVAVRVKEATGGGL